MFIYLLAEKHIKPDKSIYEQLTKNRPTSGSLAIMYSFFLYSCLMH